MKVVRRPRLSLPAPEVGDSAPVYFLTLFVDFFIFFMNVHVCSDVAEEQPVGRVSNLRVVESLGRTVRIGWTGVAGATQYRIIILDTDGKG